MLKSAIHISHFAVTRRGFSLTEVLIALGIFVAGLAMAAALYPAALSENQDSVDQVRGSIICRNGLAVAKLKIKHDDVTPPFSSGNLSLPNPQLDDADKKYAGSETLGFLVLGRKINGNNDYQLVIVSYNKQDSANNVTTVPTNCSVSGTSVTGAGNLRVGSPFIDALTGQYATLTEVNAGGTEGTLDRAIDASGNVDALVIVEAGVDDVSPALAVLVTRTSLR